MRSLSSEKKIFLSVPIVIFSIFTIMISGCSKPGDAKIDAVYFAQKHVMEPENALYKLFSNLEALIKVHVVSPSQSQADVQAILNLDGKTLTMKLAGPDKLPDSIPNGPGVIQHSYDNTFTGFIPKEWVQPGLSIEIQAGDKTYLIDDLKVGAPSKIVMTMFDVHYFDYTPGDYPEGWKVELESKWPTAEMEVRRVPNIIFPELIIPPRGEIPAARVDSKEDYKVKTGFEFDGEQAAALAWKSALKAAAGINGRFSLYYINIYGANAGGQAWDFGGVGNGTSPGVLIHELGHAFLLPHWGNNEDYPYRGNIYGIPAPENFKYLHAGPTWAFDLPNKAFIPPTVQENAVKPKGGKTNIVGTYKLDPMQGGGVGDQEEGYIFRHFSDYSIYKAQNYLEQHIVIWDEGLNNYVSWDDQTGAYTNTETNNGVEYPIERDVDVISVMAATSAVTPQATLVYPPIGPYSSGIIKTFDPSIEEDRNEAKEIFCEEGGCDLSVRVTQGDKVSVYMLRASLDPEDNSLITQAVNLKASDGDVTKIELLNTPDAEVNGLPENPVVLDVWEK
ncbi:MAG: M66 family metalloprotease [Candidatus Curtissbacteria bacterium]